MGHRGPVLPDSQLKGTEKVENAGCDDLKLTEAKTSKSESPNFFGRKPRGVFSCPHKKRAILEFQNPSPKGWC